MSFEDIKLFRIENGGQLKNLSDAFAQTIDYYPATNTALLAITGQTVGQRALQIDTGQLWKWSGIEWVSDGNLLGEQGPTGEAGLVWKGEYNAGTAYIINDAVFYLGCSYIATVAGTGNIPTNVAFWDLLAQKGAPGDMGGPNSAVDENITVFNGATGKIVKDGGKKISDLLSKDVYDVNNSGKVDDVEYINKHGIVSGCIFTVNVGDVSLYDVSAGVYYINGTKYTFAGATGLAGVGGAGTFSAVGLNASGLTNKFNAFITLTEADVELEVTTYARDESGDITTVGFSQFDMPNFIKNFYLRAKYFEETLFKNGAGKITGSATPLQIDIGGGTVNAPNLENVTISADTDIGMRPSYNVAGVEALRVFTSPYIVSNTQWDNGTDLQALGTDKYAVHTLNYSMRTKTPYITISKAEYDNLGTAESQEPNLGVFEGTDEGSFIEPLALLIVKEGQPDFQAIIDVRGGKIATTLDAIAGQTIENPTAGDILTWNGIQYVSQAPSVSAGQGVSYFLGNNIISGDNFDLTIQPVGGVEVEVQQTANSGDSPKFIERYVSPSLGGSQIDGGEWAIRTYASVSADQGTTEIKARINKAETKVGTITSTGTGLTRTFTATEAGTFLVGDADASILNATLIETPTETFWIDSYISDTVVIATTDQAGYVNESGVGFDMYYKLFETTTGDINGGTATLYEQTTVQPAFAIDPDNKILIAYFLEVTTGGDKTVSLYKNGTEHYSHLKTPLILRHNSMSGLNEGDYRHLTEAQFNSLTNGLLNADALHKHSVINGVTVSGIPSLDKILVATSETTAEWQTPSGGGGAVSVLNTFTQAGTIASGTYGTWSAGQAGTMAEFNAGYLIAPTGTSATIEVFKNDVSMGTITITAGSGTQSTLTGGAYVKFDKFHYVVTEGGTIAGSGLTINAITS